MTHGEMDEMVGQIVHDLRTPLSAISGYAELLEEETDPELQRRFVRNIRRAAAEMADLLLRVRSETRERTGCVQSQDNDV